MVEADEGKGMMHILLVLPHYRYPGAFGTRVDLHQYVLNSGCFTRSLLQNNLDFAGISYETPITDSSVAS